MTDPSDRKSIESLLSNCVGPSPWYWQTFPSIVPASGHRLDWTLENEKMYVRLGEKERTSVARLAMGTYSRPFVVRSNLLGIWYPKGNDIFLNCVDPDKLDEFKIESIAFGDRGSVAPYLAKGRDLCSTRITLSSGHIVRRQPFPDLFTSIDELLLIGGSSEGSPSSAACVIVSARPRLGEVEFFPQHWFNAEKFDLGYQWVTRVARHPNSGRIIGDGIRIGPFMLSEDCMNLEVEPPSLID
jgi:hypothetical protein